jgi:malate dehydrogenase
MKTGVNVTEVHDVIIWGNHSNTQFPDVNHGYIMKDGKKVPIREAVNNDTWLNGDLISCV